MKSGLFLTHLSELRAAGHYSLTGKIELPWNGTAANIPLRFSPISRIEFRREPSHGMQMSESQLLSLMERMTEQYAVIRQATGVDFRFCVSIQGELGFNGVGRDIELARYGNPHSNGLYFDISRLAVSNDRDMLFRHPNAPISVASGLASYIDASYKIIMTWMREQHGLTVS